MYVEKREEAVVFAAGAEHGFVRDERIEPDGICRGHSDDYCRK